MSRNRCSIEFLGDSWDLSRDSWFKKSLICLFLSTINPFQLKLAWSLLSPLVKRQSLSLATLVNVDRCVSSTSQSHSKSSQSLSQSSTLSFTSLQVFYASSGSDVTLFLVSGGEVKLPWIKFHLPDSAKPPHVVNDAALCPGMAKLLVGTTRGRLLVYDGHVKHRTDDLGEMENVKMVKVAHEVSPNFWTLNFASSLTGKSGSAIGDWLGKLAPPRGRKRLQTTFTVCNPGDVSWGVKNVELTIL